MRYDRTARVQRFLAIQCRLLRLRLVAFTVVEVFCSVDVQVELACSIRIRLTVEQLRPRPMREHCR
jgi:hypothetical protein